MIVLDTNIVIEYVNNEPSVVRWIDRFPPSQVFGISTLSYVELFSQETAKSDELDALTTWVQFRRLLDVSLTIAHQAAQVRRDYGLKTVDSVIAATALVHNKPLASRDRAFRKVSELELIVP